MKKYLFQQATRIYMTSDSVVVHYLFNTIIFVLHPTKWRERLKEAIIQKEASQLVARLDAGEMPECTFSDTPLLIEPFKALLLEHEPALRIKRVWAELRQSALYYAVELHERDIVLPQYLSRGITSYKLLPAYKFDRLVRYQKVA